VEELLDDTRLDPAGDGVFCGTITPRWNIGTAPNGGYVLALGLGAAVRVSPYPDPIVATGYFVRPTVPGPAEVHTEIVKIGKRFATVQARIVQDGDERTRILATLGELPGDDTIAHLDAAPPRLPPREACVRERPAGGVPEIANRFDMALDPPSIAFMRGERSEHAVMQGYVRFKDGGVPDVRALALLADAFPPPVFHVVPMSWVPTLELTVQMRARPRTEWLLARFTTRFVVNGLLEEDGELWDEDGRLLAISRQTAVLPR
jgi:acyl-CoA thioesterase